jgi:hypothetical protein
MKTATLKLTVKHVREVFTESFNREAVRGEWQWRVQSEYMDSHGWGADGEKNPVRRFQHLRFWLYYLGVIALRLRCALTDHDWEDCSTAGPDSGDMDHCCKRCGYYVSVPLY